MSDDDIPEKDRRLVAVVSIIADRDEKIEQLQRERDELKAALSVSNTAHHEIKMAAVAEWKAKAEQLQRERDDIHTLWLKCCSNSVALVHQHDELKAQIERLTYELKRWKEVEANRPDWEKLWGEQSEKADELKAQIARWEGIANGLGKQVQRLLAKEGERISDALRSGRISEAMKKD